MFTFYRQTTLPFKTKDFAIEFQHRYHLLLKLITCLNQWSYHLVPFNTKGFAI